MYETPAPELARVTQFEFLSTDSRSTCSAQLLLLGNTLAGVDCILYIVDMVQLFSRHCSVVPLRVDIHRATFTHFPCSNNVARTSEKMDIQYDTARHLFLMGSHCVFCRDCYQ